MSRLTEILAGAADSDAALSFVSGACIPNRLHSRGRVGDSIVIADTSSSFSHNGNDAMKSLKKAAIFCGMLMLAGCGSKPEVELAPVSGKVTTKDGKPVADATVSFHPTDSTQKVAPGSSGKTNSDGEFTLKTIKGSDGAMVGEHSVRISLVSDDESDDSGVSVKNKIDRKYNDNSEIKFNVTKDGSDSANFQVEYAKSRSRQR